MIVARRRLSRTDPFFLTYSPSSAKVRPMRILHTAALLFPLLLTVGLPLSLTGTGSHEAPLAHVITTSATLLVQPVTPVVIEDPVYLRYSAQFQNLHDHVLATMRSWSNGSKELQVVDLNDLAADIAAAVLLEPTTITLTDGHPCDVVHGTERCFWPDGWSSNGDKAVLLAAIAYYEGSRFSSYVDDGRCNDKTWRKDPANARTMKLGGACDGGHAWSLWQIHPFTQTDPEAFSVCSRDLVSSSRLGAARCALDIARRSMLERGNLSWYAGESAYSHPKADERLEFARRAVHGHPFVQR